MFKNWETLRSSQN